MADFEIPEELVYTREDEWVRREGDRVVIGVTDFAQSQLGDIVFVELPAVGTAIESGVPFGTIESVKAVSDLFAPISGEVLSINEALEEQPELVNEACYGDGWLFALRPTNPTNPAELESLLDANGYRAFISERES